MCSRNGGVIRQIASTGSTPRRTGTRPTNRKRALRRDAIDGEACRPHRKDRHGEAAVDTSTR